MESSLPGLDLACELEFEEVGPGEPFSMHALLTAAARGTRPVRPPINICLVLDRSGSMKGDKLRYTVDSARMLIEQLGPADRLSIVFYDSTVFTVMQPSAVKEREALFRMLDRVQARGSTNLSGGWMQGLRLAEKARMKDGVNRVLLMTDGLANRGVTDTSSLVEIAASSREKGVITTTLGFGDGFNEDLLTSIATAAGGNFHFIRDPDDAPQAFASELGDMMGMAAQNLQAVFEASDGVRFSGFLNRSTCKVEEVRAEIVPGDVFLGDKRTVCLSFSCKASARGTRDLFGVRVEYDDLSDAGRAHVHEMRASVRVSPSGPGKTHPRNPSVAAAVALFRSGEAKRKAMSLADAGDHAAAAEALENALEAFDGLPDSPEISAEKADLALFADSMRKASWDNVGRKSLSASIFRSQVGRVSIAGPRPRIIDTRVDGK